jgi:hypothetical protein
MDCTPTRSAILDYGSRWAIEPTFSDFKSRGFQLEDSQLKHPARLERLILIMDLAMHWCVRIGLNDAVQRPTPLEKNQRANRPHALEFQETPSQHGLILHQRTAILEKMLAK